MIIVPPEEHVGIAGKAGSRFTGDVYSYLTCSADGTTINTVNFTPGARTHWHAHEAGQILQVLAGRGLIQSAGGQIEVLRAGFTVWVLAGERHWHGAAPDSFMTHTAISLGVTSWDEPVADSDYHAPLKEGQA